jgi:hypothetical protein
MPRVNGSPMPRIDKHFKQAHNHLHKKLCCLEHDDDVIHNQQSIVSENSMNSQHARDPRIAEFPGV